MRLEISKLESEIAEQIRLDDELSTKYLLLLDIPGMLPRTAMALVVQLPELGSVNRGSVVSIAGLVPGTTKKGRGDLRTQLYRPAIVASRYNLFLHTLYKQKIEKGKDRKIAILVVASQLITYANSLIAKRLHSSLPPVKSHR